MKNKRIDSMKDCNDLEDVSHFLYTKFMATGHSTIKDWLDSVNLNVSQETVGRILYRKGKPGIKSLLEIGIALGISNEELAYALKTFLGDTLIYHRLQPSIIGAKEHNLLSLWHSLTDAQQSLVMNMMTGLKGA